MKKTLWTLGILLFVITIYQLYKGNWPPLVGIIIFISIAVIFALSFLIRGKTTDKNTGNTSKTSEIHANGRRSYQKSSSERSFSSNNVLQSTNNQSDMTNTILLASIIQSNNSNENQSLPHSSCDSKDHSPASEYSYHSSGNVHSHDSGFDSSYSSGDCSSPSNSDSGW